MSLQEKDAPACSQVPDTSVGVKTASKSQGAIDLEMKKMAHTVTNELMMRVSRAAVRDLRTVSQKITCGITGFYFCISDCFFPRL